MIDKFALSSTVAHIVTFVSMGLAGLYTSYALGFVALVSLLVGLIANKLIHEELLEDQVIHFTDNDRNQYDSDDPYLSQLLHKPEKKA